MKGFFRLNLAGFLLFLSPFLFAEDAADQGVEVNRFLANYVTAFYNPQSNGFPRNEANVVLQTSDGFIWFGGFDGLIRYDSNRFTQWNALTQDNFTSSSVRSLYESLSPDEGHILWIGTNDKGLFSLKNGIFTNYDMSMGSPSNMIRCITERADGMIFCGTSDGLFFIDAEKNIIVVDLDTHSHQFIISLAADLNNNIFMVLNTGELLCFSAEANTIQYPFASRFQSIDFINGSVFAGTQYGEVFITNFINGSFSEAVIKQTPNLNISAFHKDSRGFIWITSETGIGFFDDSLVYHHIGNPTGAGFYSDIIEDYQNTYWISSLRGGVVKYSLSAFTDFNVLNNFPTGSVNAVVIDNGLTYIGTDNNLYIIDEMGKPVFTDFTELINVRVRGIFRDTNNYIWICTYSEMGAIRFDPLTGEYRFFTPQEGLASDRTRSFTELNNGVIAIGTAAGVSFIKGDFVISAGEAFETDIPLYLPATMILSLCVREDGTLFIGSDGSGVYIVNREGVINLREDDGLTSGVILRMFVCEETQGVWVSPSGGLCYIDLNNEVLIIDKVPPHAFLDILQYHDELVLLTSTYVIRTNSRELLVPELPFSSVVMGRTAGLSASITPNAWNWIVGNELYLCIDQGIYINNFEQTLSPAIPYVGIKRIDIDGREYTNFTEVIHLENTAFRMTIDLAYISFGLLDTAEMYYILEGQDSAVHLMPKGGSNELSYTNLRGGNYTFRVWTEDALGLVGNIIEVNLQKELLLLEYPVVWVLFVVLGALVIALLFNLIYRHKIRTQRLAMENTALDRVNRFKTDLMHTISHEMRTPLAVISGFAEITAENSRKNMRPDTFVDRMTYKKNTAMNLDVIASEAKRMANMVEEMHHFAMIKEISKDRRPVNIVSLIKQIAMLYEKVLERKGIELILMIDDELLTVLGNESELIQVLFNLLRNAEKHTEAGKITVTINCNGAFVETTVSDTGSGIAPDMLPHVFESGVHGEEGGTGLGLSICRDIVKAYQGEISIESQVGKGTQVKIVLPLA